MTSNWMQWLLLRWLVVIEVAMAGADPMRSLARLAHVRKWLFGEFPFDEETGMLQKLSETMIMQQKEVLYQQSVGKPEAGINSIIRLAPSHNHVPTQA